MKKSKIFEVLKNRSVNQDSFIKEWLKKGLQQCLVLEAKEDFQFQMLKYGRAFYNWN